MTQYYSRTDIPYAGDSNFTIPFSYIDKNDIHVYINDTLISTWVWLNDSQIDITSTLQAGDVVSIRRITPIDEKIVTYQNMSMVLSDDNLNLSQDQVLNAVQEVYDNNVSFQIDVNAQIDEIDTKVDTANTTANQALSNSETAISTANEALSNSEDAVTTANTAETKADNAVSTANTASTNASQAVSTANEANTNAQSAVSTANSAADDASEALTKANTAISTANTAKDMADTAKDTADEALADSATALTNSETAISIANDAADDATEAVATANTANTNASNAVSTANSASSAANSAVSTANSAATAANSAVSTANTASTNASTAIARAEEAIEIAQTAVSQGLTPATTTTLGGIKVGDNLSITADGTLSADAQSIEVDDELSTTSENPVQNKAIPSYIVSRGENLVSNGFATLGNNYNFTTMTYTGADTYGAGGCFYKTDSSSGRVRTDEFMPIDITQSYKLSYAVKNTTLTSTYDFIDMYDIDFNRIAAGNCGFTAGTTTTLAQDLKNGDTVIYFTDLSNWNTESTSQYLRALIFWKYKNSFGYEYPTEYYSRYWWYNLWDDSSVAIDKVNNTITLKSAWNHGTFEAGHPVSQGTLSGSNVYGNSNYQPTPNTWEVKTYTFEPSKYRNATAYIQLGWLTNYSNQTDNTFSVSSISFTSNVALSDFIAYTATEVETLWGSI